MERDRERENHKVGLEEQLWGWDVIMHKDNEEINTFTMSSRSQVPH